MQVVELWQTTSYSSSLCNKGEQEAVIFKMLLVSEIEGYLLEDQEKIWCLEIMGEEGKTLLEELILDRVVLHFSNKRQLQQWAVVWASQATSQVAHRPLDPKFIIIRSNSPLQFLLLMMQMQTKTVMFNL